MRISDWSSDVCSSDLRQVVRQVAIEIRQALPGLARHPGGDLRQRDALAGDHRAEDAGAELGTGNLELQVDARAGSSLAARPRDQRLAEPRGAVADLRIAGHHHVDAQGHLLRLPQRGARLDLALELRLGERHGWVVAPARAALYRSA